MVENNNLRMTWEEMYFAIAEVVAMRSKDPRTKVGAVLVKEGCVIGIGYNGEPRNFNSSFDWNSHQKYNHVVHAEMNAVANACRMGVSVNNSEIYVTLSPCHNCMNILIQHGVKAVYYKKEYKDIALTLKIANSSGIILKQYK